MNSYFNRCSSSLHEIKPYPFAINLNKNYPGCAWWKKACRKEHVLPLFNSPPFGKNTLTMPNIVTTAFECFSDFLWLLEISKPNAFVSTPFLLIRYIILFFLLLSKWFWLLMFFPWKIAMMLLDCLKSSICKKTTQVYPDLCKCGLHWPEIAPNPKVVSDVEKIF